MKAGLFACGPFSDIAQGGPVRSTAPLLSLGRPLLASSLYSKAGNGLQMWAHVEHMMPEY